MWPRKRVIHRTLAFLGMVGFSATMIAASSSSALATTGPQWGSIISGVDCNIPEPASWVLLATGICGMALLRKRRWSREP